MLPPGIIKEAVGAITRLAGRAATMLRSDNCVEFLRTVAHIFRSTCEHIGIHRTSAGPYTTYVSRKADVATLDGFIGPKS